MKKQQMDALNQGLSKLNVTMDAFSKNFNKSIENAAKSKTTLTTIGNDLGKIGSFIDKSISQPISNAFDLAINSASKAEMVNVKFALVFKGVEEKTRKWAENHANLIGRSVIDIKSYLADTQHLLTIMGETEKVSKDLSKDIVELGLSYALFHNISDADAIKSLGKAIAGNAKEVEALGIRLDDTVLSLAMQSMGIKKNYQNLKEHEKQQVRYNAILMQSNDLINYSKDNTDSFRNQLLRLKGVTQDTAAAFGKAMLPMLTNFISTVGDVIKWFGELDTWAQYAILGIGGVLMAIGPLISSAANLILAFDAFIRLKPVLAASFGALSKGIFSSIIGMGVLAAKVVMFAGALMLIAALGYIVWETLKQIGEKLKPLGTAIKNFFSNDKEKYKNMDKEYRMPTFGTSPFSTLYKGTYYHPGGLALVGERGPELLSLPKGSRVATNYRTERILSNSSNATIDGSLQSNISSSSVNMPFAPQIVVNVEGREVNDSKTTLIKREVRDQILPMLEEYFSIMRLKHPILIER